MHIAGVHSRPNAVPEIRAGVSVEVPFLPHRLPDFVGSRFVTDPLIAREEDLFPREARFS